MKNQGYKISFCITCKGRLEHLKQTLPQNLASTTDYPNVEFVILDYDSPDGLEDWVKEHYKAEIESGKIRYAKFEPAPYFYVAHAKNMAHRVATGDILCNLDADNLLAPGFASWLNEEFSKDKDIYVRPHRLTLLERFEDEEYQRGIMGRIAMHRDTFMKLHGYDERYQGWEQNDHNLDARAHNSGLKRVDVPLELVGGAINHSDCDRIKNLAPGPQEQSRAFLAKKPSQGWLATLDRIKDKEGRDCPFVDPANIDGTFGCGDVVINFTERKILAPRGVICDPVEIDIQASNVPPLRKWEDTIGTPPTGKTAGSPLRQ